MATKPWMAWKEPRSSIMQLAKAIQPVQPVGAGSSPYVTPEVVALDRDGRVSLMECSSERRGPGPLPGGCHRGTPRGRRASCDPGESDPAGAARPRQERSAAMRKPMLPALLSGVFADLAAQRYRQQ